MIDLVKFWNKVDKSGKCWIWKGRTNGKKYGKFGDAYTHRLSWEIHKGPIPKGMQVCHKCDNPPCVRPSHLFLGKAQDNTDDMMRKRRNYHPGPKNPCKGERVSWHKLKSKNIRVIISLREKGHTYQTIADRFSVHETTIGQIFKGRAWKTEYQNALRKVEMP